MFLGIRIAHIITGVVSGPQVAYKISPERFARLQVRVRALHHPDFFIYANCVILRDPEAEADGFMELTGGLINIVARGLRPRLLIDRLLREFSLLVGAKVEIELANTSTLVQATTFEFSSSPLRYQAKPLCGRCIQQNARTTISRCRRGHTLSPDELLYGTPLDTSLAVRQALWDAIDGDDFMASSKWQPLERHLQLPLGMSDEEWAAIANSGLEYTELRHGDRNASRAAEYLRVCRCFYDFVSREGEHDFEVERVLFLRNPTLEGRFYECYRTMLGSYFDSGSRASHVDHGTWSPETAAHRRWVYSHLRSYLGRVSGSEHVNLVLAWHATSEKRIYQVAASGVRIPPPLPTAPQPNHDDDHDDHDDDNANNDDDDSDDDKIVASNSPTTQQQPNLPHARIQGGVVVDDGFIGRGFYLTQYPKYGDYYLNLKRKENAAAGGGIGGNGAGGEGMPNLLLLSWVLMGRAYPVIESPMGPESLHGQPCRPGYDSHYAVVSAPNYHPAKLGEKVAADELVVFRSEQVLPRYIVYYRRSVQIRQTLFTCQVSKAPPAGELELEA